MRLIPVRVFEVGDFVLHSVHAVPISAEKVIRQTMCESASDRQPQKLLFVLYSSLGVRLTSSCLVVSLKPCRI